MVIRNRSCNRVLQTALLSCAALCLPGCFRVTTLIPNHPPAETHSQWVNGFFWGSVGGTVDTVRFCGDRPVAGVTTKRTLGNFLIGLLTLGIYTPSDVAVTCGQYMNAQYMNGQYPPSQYPPGQYMNNPYGYYQPPG